MEKQKVLIVDDNEGLLKMLGRLLEQENYQVFLAANAEAALTIAACNPIDAFLLDIEMPGMSGITVCSKLREQPEYRSAPILFLTGTTGFLPSAFEAGCDDLIDKPVDHRVLKTRLQGHIRRFEYHRELDRTRKILTHYLSQRTREVAESAARTGHLPAPEQRTVVIMFTDIRGFTALSEELDPTRLFSMLSSELEMQVDLVYEYGGYVDKFGGDGLMAVFDGKDMAPQSCLCALQMMEREQRRAEEDHHMGQLGIGIHMGPVIIGNIGSKEHLDYSVIGSAVNLAARLCGHAEPMSIVVSKAARDAALNDGRIRFDSERDVVIRGLKGFQTVYMPHQAGRS